MKNSYKKFAYFYDEFTSKLEYDLWVEFTEQYLKPNDSILDLACGTGTFATMLKLKGYNSEGLDLSEEIIDIANEKRKINRLDIPFYCMDMTNFDLGKKYNVITCFFDSINFLSSTKDINKLFDCVYKHLKDDGLFIFDIFSKELFNEYSKNEIHDDYETFKIDWITKNIDSKTLKHEVTIDDFESKFTEYYYEYYYELNDLINKNFKLINMVGDFNDDYQPGDERILLVYKKR